ncbi:MAG: prepilin-type N-terminal cleavage/methylation domain-containing protein [Opitutae bacterium]
MKARSHQTHGFTLVEIMVVVVIVGLLSALAVPALLHVKKKAQETMVINTLRQVYDAKEYYFTENGGNWVNVPGLVAKGYASKSLAAAVAYPPGSWTFGTLAYLKPGIPVKSTEVFYSGNLVTYGRVITYP